MDARTGNRGTVIVGASQSGTQLATSLREAGYTAPITIVGEEPHAPYQRPPLSKGFLDGTTDEYSLEFRSRAYYVERDISLVLGERVTSAALDEDVTQGGRVTLASGRVIDFDRLALAVGARARRLSVEGSELPGVLYLRDLADAVALRDGLASLPAVVIIGGGFIGLEIAAAARSRGCAVTILEAADRLMGRAVAPVVSQFYRQAHERRGADVRVAVTIDRILGDPSGATGVELAGGEVIPATLVVVGIGVIPCLELALELGLDCRGGVLVDEFAQTSDPRVLAVGDVAMMPHPSGRAGLVRLESVQNSVEHAKVAAATIAGDPHPYRTVPWFWSDQGDLKLKIAGISTGYDQVVLRGDPDSESFSVLYYAEGDLLACDSVNAVADYLAVRRALEHGINIPSAIAADSSTPLKAALVPTSLVKG